ncbi:hypothetical protein LC065_20050 (plasmid) [Halobacillus litoralis]|uniref:hypothetical protein n=1 Tax=Halobacillus litoralis TaxID=45668 RepID=UPI001CFCFF9B|nr:hypothetical protein [Halobacillus litoralis]WLR49601.1 hypothetical protein LC065_20050 [Halobacillus litoralis]
MEDVILSLSEGLVQLLLVVVFSLASYGIKKANDFIKSKLNDSQYKIFQNVVGDIYNYVEREFGMKLGEAGVKKLNRAIDVYKDQADKHNLPYSVEDFKVQIENINKAEKEAKAVSGK